jgi:uncharacterized membrane protein
MRMSDSTPTPPAELDQSLQAISDLHAQHYRKATPVQRVLDSAVAKLSHPALLLVLTFVIVGWISVNLAMLWASGAPFDPPPFQWLQGAASVAAVYIAALILTTQRREDGLARHRDQLTLELAIMSERKSAKIIQLLEELRHDHPLVQDRVDDDAAAMAKPANPGAVLNAIEEVHRIIAEENG